MELHDLKEQDKILQRERELEQNELAKAMTGLKKKAAGHVPALAAIGLSVLVLAIVAGVMLSGRDTKTEAAWNAYLATDAADGYEEVAEEYAGTSAAPWALVEAGRQRLNAGVRKAFSDRTQSLEDIAKAKEMFETVLSQPNLPTELELQALQGRAIATESLSDGSEGSIEAAIQAYQPLAQSNRPRYSGLAQQRIAALEGDRAGTFYSWLSNQDFTPGSRIGPNDGVLPAPGNQFSGEMPADRLPEKTIEQTPDSEIDPVEGQGESREMSERTIEPNPDGEKLSEAEAEGKDTNDRAKEGGENADDQNPGTE